MKNLYADVILGLDFQSQHESVTLMFGGMKEPLIIPGLTTLKTEPSPFQNVTKDCKPEASKSWNYSDDDRFIASKEQHLYKEGITEPSTLPGRLQVVLTKRERQKALGRAQGPNLVARLPVTFGSNTYKTQWLSS